MSYKMAAVRAATPSPRVAVKTKTKRAATGFGATAIESVRRGYVAAPRSYMDVRAVRAMYGLGGVTVGSLAKHDFIVSKASLAASEILKKATLQTSGPAQLRVIRSEANKIQSGLGLRFDEQLAITRARGEKGLQAAFDALRVAIANAVADDAVERIKLAVAHEGAGAEALGATDYTGSDAACAIMSGSSVITSIIGAITKTDTAGSAGAFTQAGSNFCGARGADNAAAATDAQNQQTQANLVIAQMQAQQHAADIAAAAASQESQMAGIAKIALIGGGVLVAGLIGFAVIKKI